MSEPISDPNREPRSEGTLTNAEPRVRLWPTYVIAAIYFAALSFSFIVPTILLNVIGVIAAPLLCTLLLGIWWLFFSRVPWRDRFIGVGLLVAALVLIAKTQPRSGGQLLFLVLPFMVIGTIALLALSARAPWRLRRFIVLLPIVACAIIFPMFRVKDVTGNLVPILTPRWVPSSEDVLASSAGTKGGKADLPVAADPADWPAFRGANRDGRVTGVTFATNWNEAPPKELWRKDVGTGYSSFVAVGKYIFTQEQRKENEVVVCYKADTGEEVWTSAVKARFEESTGDGPRATPAYDSGKLYVQGALGLLQCLDASTGAVIWTKDIKTDNGAGLPQWGFASSPLVTDKHVVVYPGAANGKSVVAYDKVTGERAWCGGTSTSGYSSAHLAKIDDVPQIVMTSGLGVQSFEPNTGALLWQHDWPTGMNPRVVQPMVVDGSAVLLGTAEEKGTRYLQIVKDNDKWSAQEKWTNNKFRPYFNDIVLHKEYCYGFDGDQLDCMDAHTGEIRWKGKRYGGQVLLVADMDMLLVLGEKGDVALVKATPEKYEEVARFKALHGKTWNHPVIAHGKLFVRNADEAACYALPLIEKAI